MKYKYQGFITENVAPNGATNIVIYENGIKKGYIPLGHLTRPSDVKLFSIGLISDIHQDGTSGRAFNFFNNALSYFEQQNCVFCCHSGDMTNHGFWNSDGTVDLKQFGDYKKARELHPNLPIYGTCGNHENYFKVITEDLDKLEEYCGFGLYHSVKYQNDLFIFISQPASYQTINLEELQWLYETLESNRNIRCHIFVHVFLPNDSGNAKDVYEAYFGQYANHVKNLLKHYKNTIIYHGHSHNKFINQELDNDANYTYKNGFHSIHIPSVAHTCDVMLQEDGSYVRVPDYTSSQGYVMDVYENYIIYNGIEFTTNKAEPLGTFKINTTVVNIPEKTFVDSTGTITV